MTDTAASRTRTWSYSYDNFGRILTIDGPRTDVSDVTTYSYHECTSGNECGQVATITNAAGHTTSFLSYNVHGKPLTVTDPNGIDTTATYDARQRLTSSETAGETTTYSYYPDELLRRITAPDGSFIEYGYDAAHRVTDTSDGEGNSIHYTLNAAGDRIQEDVRDFTGALAFTRSRIFNSLGWLNYDIGAAGQTVGYTRDNLGNIENITDPQYRLTTTNYDELSRVKTVTDPVGGVTTYTYNERDEVVGVTDPRNVSTSYQYNAFGDLKRLTSPDTGITEFIHDEAGNVEQSTDARGRVRILDYDSLNRSRRLPMPTRPSITPTTKARTHVADSPA